MNNHFSANAMMMSIAAMAMSSAMAHSHGRSALERR